MRVEWKLHGVYYSMDVRKSTVPGNNNIYVYIDAGLAGSRIAIPVEQARLVMEAFASELEEV